MIVRLPLLNVDRDSRSLLHNAMCPRTVWLSGMLWARLDRRKRRKYRRPFPVRPFASLLPARRVGPVSTPGDDVADGLDHDRAGKIGSDSTSAFKSPRRRDHETRLFWVLDIILCGTKNVLVLQRWLLFLFFC